VIGHVRADAPVTKAIGDVVRQLSLIRNHQHPQGAMMPYRMSRQHHITTHGCPSRHHASWPSAPAARAGPRSGTAPRVMSV
jgi:hypothetical protein